MHIVRTLNSGRQVSVTEASTCGLRIKGCARVRWTQKDEKLIDELPLLSASFELSPRFFAATLGCTAVSRVFLAIVPQRSSTI